MKKTDYINQTLPQIQVAISRELENLGMNANDTWDALNSRLVDLEDTIDITEYI